MTDIAPDQAPLGVHSFLAEAACWVLAQSLCPGRAAGGWVATCRQQAGCGNQFLCRDGSSSFRCARLRASIPVRHRETVTCST
jgi:hypothetical protein